MKEIVEIYYKGRRLILLDSPNNNQLRLPYGAEVVIDELRYQVGHTTQETQGHTVSTIIQLHRKGD